MDITPTATITTPTSATTKFPEQDAETPTRTPSTTTTKTLSLTNGVLKRHYPHHQQHPVATNLHVAATYKECLKNHAASLGGHALDGCGEFMSSPDASATDPSSIKCAVCGCHRNFHRREPEEQPITATHVIEYQPHHRHHPPPPRPFQASNRSPNSASPPPISSTYYPSAPHMLLALSAGLAVPPESTAGPASNAAVGPNGRKRFRTKFSQEQKEKMQRFAERVGWKMQKRDEDLVQEFCNEIGVDRGVLKVWMHNNKSNFAKRDVSANGGGGGGNILEEDNPNNNDNTESNGNDAAEDPNHHYQNDGGANVGANGSPSSS